MDQSTLSLTQELQRVIDREKVDFAEKYMASTAAGLGLWLLGEPTAMQHKALWLVTAFLPQTAWASILLILAAWWWYALIKHSNKRLNGFFPAVAASVWFWFAIAVFITRGATVSEAVYGILGIKCVNTYIYRLRHQ